MHVEKYCTNYNSKSINPNFGEIIKVRRVGLFCPELHKLHAECEKTILETPFVRELSKKFDFNVIIEDSVGPFLLNRHYSSVTLKPISEVSRIFFNLINKIMNIKN